MRVLFIIPHPMFGGPHNQALRLHKALADAGIDMFLLLPAEPGNAVARLSEAGISVLTLPLHRFHRFHRLRANAESVLNLFGEVRSIRRLIRKLKIDLVQIAGLVAVQGAIAARLEMVPLVWQLVDQGPPAFVRPLVREVVIRLADSMMITGEKLRLKYFGEHCNRVPMHVYFPPVDTSRFFPSADLRKTGRAKLGIPENALVVGTVSNILPAKGLEYFLRAANVVNRSADNCWFLIVGSQYPSHRKYLEKIKREAERTEIPRERLIFAGFQDCVEGLYPVMDVCLITSLREGVPSTSIEAMACGLPLVATDVGGVAEIVAHGRTGYLAPQGDWNAIAAGVLRLLSNPALRQKMAERARCNASDRYGLEMCVQIHLAAYQSATERARGQN